MRRDAFAAIAEDVLDLLTVEPRSRDRKPYDPEAISGDEAHELRGGTHAHPHLPPLHEAWHAAHRIERAATAQGLDDPLDPYAFGKLDRLRCALRRAWTAGSLTCTPGRSYDFVRWCDECGGSGTEPGPLCPGCDRERVGLPRLL